MRQPHCNLTTCDSLTGGTVASRPV